METQSLGPLIRSRNALFLSMTSQGPKYEVRGGFVGIGAEKKNILCCVKNVGDVAVFGRLVSLFAWSKRTNDALKPVFVVAGGSVAK